MINTAEPSDTRRCKGLRTGKLGQRDGHVGTVGASSPTSGLLRAGDSVACGSVGMEGEGRERFGMGRD
jgi:hypothetical protein